MVLCKNCEAFDIQTLAEGKPRGYSYQKTVDAAAQGCNFCRVLADDGEVKRQKRKNELPEDAWFHFEAIDERASHRYYQPDPSPIEDEGQDIELSLGVDHGMRIDHLRVTLAPRYFVQLSQFAMNEYITFDFYVAADPGTHAAVNHDILGRFPGTDPLSEAHCAAVKHWLGECVGNNAEHPRCNQTISGHEMNLNASNTLLPSRCVEVLGENSARLCETDKLESPRGAYITLSHRWENSTGSCSTTTDNLDAQRARIPFSQLTKTFQDAIVVSHRIGIRYIWIDSICIIQGGDKSQEDWRKESKKMAQYYQNSIFTLAAVRGHGQAGLLPTDIQLGNRTLIRLPYRDRTGNKKGYMYLYRIDHDLRTSYGKDVRDNELLGRGWVYQ